MGYNMSMKGILNLCIERDDPQNKRLDKGSLAAPFFPSFYPNLELGPWSKMSTRSKYQGTRRRLVLAFDVGTTFSGISYRYEVSWLLAGRTTYSQTCCSVLDPGQVPEIKGVTRSVHANKVSSLPRNWFPLRYPGNELISGASKIPTIIYYDQEGEVRAVGAEAIYEDVFEAAEDGDWVKAEWSVFHVSIQHILIPNHGLSQVQATLTLKDRRRKEPHRPNSSSSFEQNRGRSLCWFPPLPLEVRSNLHQRYPRQWAWIVGLRQGRHPLRSFASKWLGREGTGSDA